jgi:hypothetical protein
VAEIYVDPSINANSGSGSIGDPYGDLQHALDSVTRDSTNGDRFNIKAGAAEVLAASLTLSTYGTPTAAAPLTFQGYTSAAGDGGIGEISGGGAYSIFSRTSSGCPVYFQDLKLGNCGSSTIIDNYDTAGVNSQTRLINCELYGTTNNRGVRTGSSTTVIGCHFHTMTGQYALECLPGGGWVGNYVVLGCHFNAAVTSQAISFTAHNGMVKGCLIRLSVAGAKALTAPAQTSHAFIGNTVLNTAAGTTTLIPPLTKEVYNNLFVGASGTGGIGMTVSSISGAFGNNAFYNCTTNVSGTPGPVSRFAADVALGSDPFVDAAGGNFAIDPASDASEAAWPGVWLGLATTTNAADIGAVQAGAGSGGGGASIYRRVARILGG